MWFDEGRKANIIHIWFFFYFRLYDVDVDPIVVQLGMI